MKENSRYSGKNVSKSVNTKTALLPNNANKQNDKASISSKSRSRSNLSKGARVGTQSSPKKERATINQSEEYWDVTPGDIADRVKS